MDKNAKILIVGHEDIITRSLKDHYTGSGYRHVFTTTDLGINTAIQAPVYAFFQEERPDYVFLVSTRSGGIEANVKHGAEFIYHNLESQNNVVYAAQKFGARKLLLFAGSCIYPKEAPQPMKEDCLLTGPLEATSEPYSIAKIAGIRLCQAYKRQYGFNAIIMVPATVYGPGSDTDHETAHVIGALIGKFARAVKNNDSEVTLWGTGQPRREFLYADDFTAAADFLMNRYDGEEIVNAGSGRDVAIGELADLIASATGYKGRIVYDASKPDGTPQKWLDSGRMSRLGWKAKVPLKEGITKTVEWYTNSRGPARRAPTLGTKGATR